MSPQQPGANVPDTKVTNLTGFTETSVDLDIGLCGRLDPVAATLITACPGS